MHCLQGLFRAVRDEKQGMRGQDMSDTKRNYGIDLLRMLSMFMIVNLHVLGQGGVMVRIVGAEAGYYASWFLETCAYCAVNCYGLISGYVGVNGKFRPARLLELWIQVFFYSGGITLIYAIAAPGLLTWDNLWEAIFPVGWKTYWYFSCYAGLFLVTPFLNKLVNSMTQRELKRMAAALFLIFSVGTAIPKGAGVDFLQLVGGYSFVWLCVLYLLGACIRKCSFSRWKSRYYLLAYFGLAAFSWAFKIVVENFTRDILGEATFGRLFTGYAAPTILLCAVCLFLIFERLECSGAVRKLIALASPLAFSVYLIHTHPLIWDYILKGAFSQYRYLPWPVILVAVPVTAAAIYVVCSAVDWVRKKLFEVMGVRRFTERIAGALERGWMRIFP